jgi:arsenate reductase
MAEGLVNHCLGHEWEAHSAGTFPVGYVHPLALLVMSELGIDISRKRSRSAGELGEDEFDVVVAVCDDTATSWPLWLGDGRKTHITLEDPALATGSEEERLAVFRRVREKIRQEMGTLLVNGNQH